MDKLTRRKFFFLILIIISLVTLTWRVLIPAGDKDNRSHQPSIAHQHRSDKDEQFSYTSGTQKIVFTSGQAEEITLRFAKVKEHRLEKWVRTAGKSDHEKRTLQGRVFGSEAKLIQRGQQVRIFPLVGTNRMLQGKVTDVTFENTQADFSEALVKVNFRDRWYRETNFYMMEIIVPMGRRLSIPHEAIIEDAGGKKVFVKNKKNSCQPRTISVGIRGEIYDEILSGLKEGEEVATFGSFFLDAEYKLKMMSTSHHTGEKN